MVQDNIKKVAVLQFDESNDKTQFLHLDQVSEIITHVSVPV